MKPNSNPGPTSVPKEHLRRARTLLDLTKRNIETVEEIESLSRLERTTGERAADAFARIVGSWKFIIAQTIFLIAWICLNIFAWVSHWDPYPFILVNLLLSFQAAYASPIIMMSQNRQASLNERRNKLDLQINLLAEQENTEMLHMLRKICKRLDIEVKHQTVHALEEDIRPEMIFEEIDRIEMGGAFKGEKERN